VKLLGAALILAGCAGTALCTLAIGTRPRPIDLAAAIGAPVALTAALVGGVLLFVPGFLG